MLLPPSLPFSPPHTASKLIELFDKADYDMVSRTMRPERGKRVALIITKERREYIIVTLSIWNTEKKGHIGSTTQKNTVIFSPFFSRSASRNTGTRDMFFFSFHTHKRDESRPPRLGRSYTVASDLCLFSSSFLQPPHSDYFRSLSTLHHQLLPDWFLFSFSSSISFLVLKMRARNRAHLIILIVERDHNPDRDVIAWG